jgi:hypothetical protein
MFNTWKIMNVWKSFCSRCAGYLCVCVCVIEGKCTEMYMDTGVQE